MYGVYHEQLGLYVFDVGEDLFDACFAKEQRLVRSSSGSLQSVGSELDLSLALFAAHVEDASLAHAQNGLKEQGRLSDARFASQEDERAGYDAATQYAVQLGVVCVIARSFFGCHLAQADGACLSLGWIFITVVL